MASKAPAPQAQAAGRAQAPSPRARPRCATRLGLTGPSGSRRRGALLRRLLAAGDWVASDRRALRRHRARPRPPTSATLFWAVLFSPVWILVLKLHGLYDNDHRRIRHSTLDELPRLISASALGTLALDGLLALSPVGPALAAERDRWSASAPCSAASSSRAVLRFFWHRLTGVATGHRDRARRRRSTWSRGGSPPTPRRACTWSATSRRRATRRPARRACRGSARSPTSPGSPREHDVERVIVTEQEMSEPAAERLIEECKAAGPGAHLPAPALRPARPGDRAQPARRAAGARLPLLRPAALDPGAEAGDGRRRLGGLLLTLLSPLLAGDRAR